MENDKWFINELTGKMVLIKTHGGFGTKDARLMEGEYRGVLLGFDGGFVKLEYEIRKFSGGTGTMTKDVILINAAYIISVNEYREDV
jgi:hypothetical protein